MRDTFMSSQEGPKRKCKARSSEDFIRVQETSKSAQTKSLRIWKGSAARDLNK